MNEDDDNNPNEERNNWRPGFHVFTNPLDMERFFNQQMDEMIKSFGIFGSFRDQNERNNGFPAIDIPRHQQREGQNFSECDKGSREFMLKEDYDRKLKSPGYIAPDTKIDTLGPDNFQNGMQIQKNTDKDLDDRGVDSEDLNKLFKNPESPTSSGKPAPPFFDNWHDGPGSLFGQFFGNRFPFSNEIPSEQIPGYNSDTGNWTTHSFSFGQSTSQSKVQLPDGSMEERTKTTDSQGNKVNKVKKTTRDGEWHCRVCVTKPTGNEECQEESSSGYQQIEDGHDSHTGDGGVQAFGSHYGNFSPFGSHKNHGHVKDHPRNEMLKGEENFYNSLFEKFFGKR